MMIKTEMPVSFIRSRAQEWTAVKKQLSLMRALCNLLMYSDIALANELGLSRLFLIGLSTRLEACFQ